MTDEQIISKLQKENAALRDDVYILNQLINHYKIAINGLALIVDNSYPAYRAEHDPLLVGQS